MSLLRFLFSRQHWLWVARLVGGGLLAIGMVYLSVLALLWLEDHPWAGRALGLLIALPCTLYFLAWFWHEGRHSDG